jgi:hypothetical protein
MVRTFGPGSKDPGTVQFNWFIKDRVVCGLPVVHAPKRSHGIIRKESGNLSDPGLPILTEV